VLIAAIEQTADLPAFTKANSAHGCNPVPSFTCINPFWRAGEDKDENSLRWTILLKTAFKTVG
jgi:hypothetical protein